MICATVPTGMQASNLDVEIRDHHADICCSCRCFLPHQSKCGTASVHTPSPSLTPQALMQADPILLYVPGPTKAEPLAPTSFLNCALRIYRTYPLHSFSMNQVPRQHGLLL